jgi:hypothetical protein
MKKSALIVALFLMTSTGQANIAQCTAEDGTVLRGRILESPMMAQLIEITIQAPGQGAVAFPSNVEGTVYSDLPGDPTIGILLDIYDTSTSPPTALKQIKSPIQGKNDVGNILIDIASGHSQPVTCIEVAERPYAQASDSSKISDKELSGIVQIATNAQSGTILRILLKSGTAATCRINSMAELPGYNCSLRLKKRLLHITNSDVKAISNLTSRLSSGQPETIILESGEQLQCTQNSFAETVGYSCK